MYKLSIAKQVGGAVVATFIASGTVSAATVLSNSHNYGGLVTINVTVEDNYLGDFSKYFWKYDVTNHTYDPNPGTSNGFSGFELGIQSGEGLGLADMKAPNSGWDFNCCSGDAVEYDIRNSAGLGIMPGESGSFSFTSLPVSITNSPNGWWHSWENDSQTAIRNFSEFTGATGPEIPVIPEPETYTMLMIGLGLVGFIVRRKQVTSRA
jgi:hypothetical protein